MVEEPESQKEAEKMVHAGLEYLGDELNNIGKARIANRLQSYVERWTK